MPALGRTRGLITPLTRATQSEHRCGGAIDRANLHEPGYFRRQGQGVSNESSCHHELHTAHGVGLRRGRLPAWISEVIHADLCIFALHAEKGPVGYLNEIMSCDRIPEVGIWTGKSLLARAMAYQRTFDLLNLHCGGSFQPLLHLLEYRIGTAYWLALVCKGMPGEARELSCQTFPRLVRSMPLRVLSWAGVAHCPDRCLAAALRVSRVLLIRPRFRLWEEPEGDSRIPEQAMGCSCSRDHTAQCVAR